jgi:hypothetical protein
MLTPRWHLTQYTSGICRGPCNPDFYCGLFHLPDLDTDLDCGYPVYLTRHRFGLWVVPFPWSRYTDFDYWILRFKWGTRRVCSVNRGCLLLDTWSYLWFLQGSVFAQFSGFVFHTGFMRLITFRYITFSFWWAKNDDSLELKTAIYIN